MITPINIAKEKPLVTSPPKMNKIKIVKNTVKDVIIVRLNVWLMALLMIVALSTPFIIWLSSRIRSYTITVSFIEKPITVRMAAIKCWSISNGKGTTFLKKLNTIKVTNISCNREKMVPKEYLQSRKRINMYKQMAIKAKMVAFVAPAFKSSEIVGSTV